MNGDQFRARRKAIGLTQKELAEAFGYSRPQIVRIEAGIYQPAHPEMIELAFEALERRIKSRLRHQKEPND